eukprot:XP_016661312.1 PREDICTED: rutC family protein jhp_0879-like [Acyrthosiphon pisum]
MNFENNVVSHKFYVWKINNCLNRLYISTSLFKLISSTFKLEKEVEDSLEVYQAVQAGNVLYVSGSLGLDEKTLKPVEGGAAAEARQSLKNIHAILKHAGTSFDKIAKTTVLLNDINNAKFVNEVYQEFVKEPYPARSTYQVAKLPLDALVEIEVIAIVEE